MKLLGNTLYFSHEPTLSCSLNTRHLNYLIWINAKFNLMQTQKERGKRSPGINPVIYVWECKALTSSNWSSCNNRSGPPWKIWQLFIGAAVIEGLGTWWYFYTQIMTAGTRIPQIPPSVKNTGQAQYTHLHSHWEDLRGAVQQRITSIPILERKPENSYITPLWEKKKKYFFMI